MKGTENHEDHAENGVLEELFRHASARERPPAADQRAVREALHAQWREMTGRRRRRRTMISLAAAASAVLAVLVGINLSSGPDGTTPVMKLAVIEKQTGTVLIYPPGGGAAQSVDNAGTLNAGHRIVTSAGSRLAVRWLNGESIRLDENTDLRLESDAAIDLASGRIYMDTDEAESGSNLVIATPAAVVRHLGTRYMTAVPPGGTIVSVRGGQVLIDADGAEAVAGSGEQLSVGAGATPRRDAISTYGPLWAWTEELAPVYSSDGRSMAEFLQWVGRESGRSVEFASAEAASLAAETVLRGNVDMEPMRALALMLQTSDLESEVEGGRILVRLRNSES